MIKPVKISIEMEYICENCGFYIWATKAQSDVGFLICSYCDHKNITKVNKQPNPTQTYKQQSNVNIPPSDGIDYLYVRDVLKKMEVDKKHYADIIRKVKETSTSTNTDDFLKECLAIINEY